MQRPLTAPRAFHLLAKPTGAICNLDCAYCFFLAKEELYPGSGFRMPPEVHETYVRQLLDAHRGVDEVPGQRSHVDTERRPVGLVDVDRLRLDAFQLVVSPIAHEGAPSVDRAASTAASSL